MTVNPLARDQWVEVTNMAEISFIPSLSRLLV